MNDRELGDRFGNDAGDFVALSSDGKRVTVGVAADFEGEFILLKCNLPRDVFRAMCKHGLKIAPELNEPITEMGE